MRLHYIIYTMHLPGNDNRQMTEWEHSADYDRVLAVFRQYVPSWESLNRETLPRYIPELQTTLDVVDYIVPFERMIDVGGWAREDTDVDRYGD